MNLYKLYIMVRISLSIPKDLYIFLQKQCISPSKLLQKEINRLITEDLNSVKCKPFTQLDFNLQEVMKRENNKNTNSDPK